MLADRIVEQESRLRGTPSQASGLAAVEVIWNLKGRCAGIRRENFEMLGTGRKIRLPDHMG